jgi:pyruvate formate lyase activating enzyme
MAIDPIEKKPLFHFFPGTPILSLSTAGCNFHCLHCQNSHISQVRPDAIPYRELSAKELIANTLSHPCQLIAFTYTEPTIYYEYMFDIAKLAHQQEIKTVMISNGYINRDPLLELIPFIDAMNIDLKFFDNNLYRKTTTGSLNPVLRTLKTVKESGVWLEITNLVIPDHNDSLEAMEEMCHWLANNGFKDTPLHFSRFYPTYKLTDTPPTPVKTLLKAREIALQHGIQYVYLGNVAHTKDEDSYCHNCNALLIERYNYAIREYLLEDGKCPDCGTDIPGRWHND